MAKNYVECKTELKNHKRRLVYHNKRTNKSLPIVVGKRGGLSVKSPKSKTRRYISKQCKNAGQAFKDKVKSLKKK
jgi:hypothetical protein